MKDYALTCLLLYIVVLKALAVLMRQRALHEHPFLLYQRLDP